MKVIIMGCGRVGVQLSRLMDSEGHDVTVIDPDAKNLANLGAEFKGHKLNGVGFDRDVLIKAGVEQADAFVATSHRVRKVKHERYACREFLEGSARLRPGAARAFRITLSASPDAEMKAATAGPSSPGNSISFRARSMSAAALRGISSPPAVRAIQSSFGRLSRERMISLARKMCDLMVFTGTSRMSAISG